MNRIKEHEYNYNGYVITQRRLQLVETAFLQKKKPDQFTLGVPVPAQYWVLFRLTGAQF